jgi:hypothetical protein
MEGKEERKEKRDDIPSGGATSFATSTTALLFSLLFLFL